MATLTNLAVTRGGVPFARVACAGGGDQFANDGRQIFVFRNSDSASKTVTITTQATLDGKLVASRSLVVAAADDAVFGPFPPAVYNNGSGYVLLTYSSVVNCSIQVLTVPVL